MGSEWRTFSSENNSADRSRVGATEVSLILICLVALPPISLHGIGAIISIYLNKLIMLEPGYVGLSFISMRSKLR